jgi:hypothetical protein
MTITWRLSNVQMKTILTRKNCFRYLKLMSPLNVTICTTISYTLWVESYYLKNNYLTLRSKVKVPRRPLQYATHHLMVMHPHTKYHWPISKDKKCYDPDKKILFKKQLFDLEVKVPRRSLRYATYHLMVMHPHTKYHWPISKDKNVMTRTRKYYLKNNYLTLRSKSHEGHYGMQHTTLWSCTHIPNIIDLSRKTKMLWPGQENTI